MRGKREGWQLQRMRLKHTSSKTKTGLSCESKDGREAAAAAGGKVEAAEEAVGAEELVVNTLPGGA